MRKIIVVAVREYQAAVRTKAFLISLFALPVLWGGMIGVQVLMHDKVDTKDKKFAIVDHTGRLYEAIEEDVHERNETGIFKTDSDNRKQIKPRFLIEKVEPNIDDPARLQLELSQRVRDKELLAFVIIGEGVIEPDDDSEEVRAAYYSNSPTYDDFLKWVSQPINRRVHQLRFEAAKLDPDMVRQATRETKVANLGLVELDEAGNITEAKETNVAVNMIVPVVLMMPK